jgi:metal transporter CNNM
MVAATARPLSSAAAVTVQGEDTAFGSLWWWAYAGVSAFLVLFAGIMSGLTLGLMSLGIVDLEILLRSGTNAEKAQAG